MPGDLLLLAIQLDCGPNNPNPSAANDELVCLIINNQMRLMVDTNSAAAAKI